MTLATNELLLAAYGDKPASYYGNPRLDYLAALPVNPAAQILELGCGSGATGALALRDGKCARYVGIERFAPMADRAREVLSEVIVGDIERLSLPFAPRSFDALICGEVLEHLIDPAATLAGLVPLLKPGARVYASVPNVAHWRIIANLARGRFEYADEGVMDRTHLRWFTPRSFRALFERAGIVVDRVRRLAGPIEGLVPVPHWFWLQIDLRGRIPAP